MTKIPQWIVNVVIVVLFSAYGFIFSSVIDRISHNEQKIENINPTLLKIQTDISSINANIEWIKRQK